MPQSLTQKGLSDREREFAEAFAHSGNASAAAKSVGLKHPRVAGPRMRNRPRVQQYIELLRGKIAKARTAHLTSEVAKKCKFEKLLDAELVSIIEEKAPAGRRASGKLAAITLGYRRLGIFETNKATAVQKAFENGVAAARKQQEGNT